MTLQAERTKKRTRQRVVMPCDFRASGLLSNESTRQLRSLHETFARALSHSLDLFLSSPVEVKLERMDQAGARELGAMLSGRSYLVPFSLYPMQEKAIVKFDSGVLFPLLDLLLGGAGEPLEHSRELTEIDEELFRSVTELIGTQLERVWRGCNVAVAPLPSVKSALMGQLFAMEERVVILHFEIRLVTTASSFMLVLPMTFASALVRNNEAELTRHAGMRPALVQRFRDRLLQCQMTASVDLAGLRVPIGDLLSLQEGAVLNLRTPVQTAVVLHISGHDLFEVTPARRHEYKAAMLVSQRDSEV